MKRFFRSIFDCLTGGDQEYITTMTLNTINIGLVYVLNLLEHFAGKLKLKDSSYA